MVLICNPRAGSGKVLKALPEVRRHLASRGLDHELRFTERPRHATEIARAALAEGKRFIVAVGGDGTVNEVVNGMMTDDHLTDDGSVFGVIASGTGCDFIKTFGIPAMPGHAVAHLDGPESFPVDIGKITMADRTHYFANVAEAGLGGDVAARLARLPGWLGPTGHLVAFWLTILAHGPVQATVDLVDRRFEGAITNLVVANGQFSGSGMKIAPRAAPTDGLLDVQIQHLRKAEAIAVLPRAYKGEHVPHPDISEAKRVRVAITSARPLRVEADGEVLGHTPATFEVLPDALRLKV
jgi:diacylglycerol kinase (ATP)